MKRFLCSILCIAMLLSLAPAAFAAGPSGLAAFTDSKQYSDGTFTDVAADAWYAASIQTVYEKAIMDGTGGGQFNPNSTIPWSQAVTIAARLHAIYHGKDIPAADGLWYAQYLAYARDNGLLPAICPDDAETDTIPITREGMAVLFRSVLDEADLPAVNDQSIPDLNEVRAEYRDAVSEMFASGIFTGIDGLFDPNGNATRAQVATIIARLLCPGQRVSNDSRQNPYMLDQMGNFYNGGLCARLGDTVYYLYNEDQMDDQGNIEEYHAIFARSDSGQVRQVYACPGTEELGLLSVGSDGLLYFTEEIYQNDHWNVVLKRLDPVTGAATDAYKTTDIIYLYLFYDNELYVCEGFLPQTRLGRVVNGRMTTLVTIPYGENTYVNNTMYCFGGKMYWLQLAPRDSKGDDHLMIMDLKTGKTDSVVTKANRFAYQGATAWTTEYSYSDDSSGGLLKRRSLVMPELTETIRVLDGEFAQLYPNLYANGSQLYYQVSGAQKLWTVSASGQTEEIATTRTPYYEGSAVTSQGIALMVIKDISSNIYSQIDFILPDGQRKPIPAILNRPYPLEGENQLTATDDQVSWDPTDEGNGEISCDVTRAYLTPDGDVVLEVMIADLLSGPVRINHVRSILDGAVKGDVTFYLSKRIEGGQNKTFTLVFPKGTVEVTGPMEDIEPHVLVKYSNNV